MNASSDRWLPRTVVRDFFATVWPISSATDSELQRRVKLAVRSGQLAVIGMVVAAVLGAIVVGNRQMSALNIANLLVAGLAYIVWSLHGMRAAVRLLLWERGTAPPLFWSPGTHWRAVFYFTIQLSLATLIYYFGDQGRAGTLVWLVLLPPVAHSVILLPRLGVAAVSVLSMGILVFNTAWWHGWKFVPNALLAFSFAVLFTLVFTLLAVSSDKARREVQRLASELTEANAKLREYAVQAEELAASRERNRLAREIHDSLGHYLTVVNVQIEAARALLDRNPDRVEDALDTAQSLTQKGLQEIRHSVSALRASPLANKPLAEALRQVVDETGASGLTVDMQVLGETRALSPQVELTLYRTGQEGLTNVRKHAHATSARLVLDFRTAAKVCVSVRDDGAGAEQIAGGGGRFGLLGLRERAQLLGGEVRVHTSPGAGFTLEVEVPA